LRGGGRLVVDLGEHVVHLHGVSFVPQALREHAALQCRNLDGDLVGLELDERFTGGHGLAFALQPAGDGCLHDRLAELGDFDGDH
jgi:hypothetical protein